MHKGTAFILMLITFVVGYFLGGAVNKGGARRDETPGLGAAKEPGKPGAPAKPGDDVERYRVPLEGPTKGPATAKINIVEFSDFQCPFCTRVLPTLDKLMKEYPGQIRLTFRHNPLDMHPDAPLAAQAAAAADAQGKFWEMHDKLFANQQGLKRPDLDKYAQEIGLDVAKFKEALDSDAYRPRVQQDLAIARQIGAQGTPNFFVNGRPVRGAAPFEDFKKVVDDEIGRVNKLLAQGVPIGRVYSSLMQNAKTSPGEAPKRDQPKPPPASAEVYKIAAGDAPAKGGKHPKVTIIEFSEFQCPYCGRAGPTIGKILETYGEDVQVAFRHNPLSFHPNAMPAAIAAEAAREQGKFWPFHDKLFANQQALGREDFEKAASEVGIDLGKFKASIDSESGKKRISDDMEAAVKFGARGTPHFFINGRRLPGAQPFENFKAVIDEEIKKADEKLRAGASRENLYAEIIKNGLDKAAAPAPQQRPGQPDANVVYRAEVGRAPVKGAKDAMVTIVQFSDFQCPYCSRVEPTIAKILDEYKGKVRVAWKDLPLPFHNNAMPAAIAARAAGEQGKFWQMHEKLFANQGALGKDDLEKYATDLQLDMGRFKAAVAAQKGKADIEADAASGNKIGASGTPAFFVNGKFLSGAQPFEQFKIRIDEEIRNAEDLVKKGTPRGKVYDAIMKTAKTEVVRPPTPQAEAGPDTDTTVYKVEPGDAPAKGPKSAAITMVVFSDFQCPFCKRVEPTLAQIEKEYAGKIRTVWKNYPLPFHDKAGPAAEAAAEAAAQGKFWQMHDKLMTNQQLERTDLERYAEEVGLDVGKLKAALDSGKWKKLVEADMKEGQTAGVSGTPAVFINGRRISGAYPFETFKKVVDQELEKKSGKQVAKK